MGWKLSRRLVWGFFAALMLVSAVPASAQEAPVTYASACSAIIERGQEDISPEPSSPVWQCSNSDYGSGNPITYLLFEGDEWEEGQLPATFFTRISRFERITLSARDANGWSDSITYLPDDATPISAGPVFALDLPEIGPDTTAIIAKIEGPHSVTMLSEARLSADPKGGEWTQVNVMLLVLIVGLLISPLFFDLSFYIVMREKFVLLHAAMVATMIGYVMFAGGVISIFTTVSVTTMAVLGPLLWAVGVALAAFFLVEFLEEDAIPKRMRTIMLVCGWWVLIVPGFFALQLDATQAFDDTGYFLAFIPVIAVYTSCLLVALLRGSRSAKFLAGAWLPIIAASTDRMLRGMDVYSGPSTLDQLLYVALGAEVLIIAIGVADRFVSVQKERDRAITRSEVLEDAAERDPLTDLVNRRMLDRRFDELRADGFNTLALLDIDRFKDINDRFGHTFGDASLKAVATALTSEGGDNIIAVRMGGEEFLLLMRGRSPKERLERIRQAIPTRIAHDVPGLDRTVTASMGVIEIPTGGLAEATLDDLYKRADMLLYEAKQGGRNRTMYERLTVFEDDASGDGEEAAA